MAAGSISREEFYQCMETFIQLCLLSHDRWDLKMAVNGEKYLCKSKSVATEKVDRQSVATEKVDRQSVATEKVDRQRDPESLVDELQAEDDPFSAPLASTTEVFTYQYHIVYSDSYSVPVLYFNAYKPDGKLLTLDEIWENIPTYHRDRLQHDRWTFLTQQEHPLLGRPYFQLHPCHTTDLMKQFVDNDNTAHRNYLITWLSSVGPLVGLNLPLHLGCNTLADVT